MKNNVRQKLNQLKAMAIMRLKIDIITIKQRLHLKRQCDGPKKKVIFSS